MDVGILLAVKFLIKDLALVLTWIRSRPVKSRKLMYEGPSKISVMNGSPCTRRGYASIILCIYICHSIIRPHVKNQRNQANNNNVMCFQNSLSHYTNHYLRMKRKKVLRLEVLIFI